MILRTATIASIAIALIVAACEGGPSAELSSYSRDMNEWFEVQEDTWDNDPLREVEKEEVLLEQLDGLDPPSAMNAAHNLLASAYRSLLVAERREANFQLEETAAARRRGSDVIVACHVRNAMSDEFQLACLQSSRAFETYILAEISFGLDLGDACGLDRLDSTGFDNGTSACMEK